MFRIECECGNKQWMEFLRLFHDKGYACLQCGALYDIEGKKKVGVKEQWMKQNLKSENQTILDLSE